MPGCATCHSTEADKKIVGPSLSDIATAQGVDLSKVQAAVNASRVQAMKDKITAAEQARSYDLYRVCLQDNRILNAVERAHSFIRLESLMLYIAVHELVHVIRFGSGQADFNAPGDERLQEEEKVNKITRSALHPVADKDMGLVLDCFSNKYDLLESYS